MPLRLTLSQAVGTRNELEHMLAIAAIDHCEQETAGLLTRSGSDIVKGSGDPLCLQGGKFHGQRFARRRGIKKALSAIIGPFFLQHVALINQLLENTRQ